MSGYLERIEVAKPTVRATLDELETILTEQMSRLYRTALRVLRNPEDSEDALQDAMLSAFTHLDQFRGNCKMSTWMHAIVANAALNKLRRNNRRRFVSIVDDVPHDDSEASRYGDEVLLDTKPTPEEECNKREQSRILQERLRRLPLHYRTAVQLCFVDGLMRREAASKLGISTEAVKTRVHRACTLLAKQS